MTIKAKFDGRVFVPEEPVNLPVGYELEIVVAATAKEPRPQGGSTLARLAKIVKQFPENPDLPTDLAAQHDHYLYGTPKRP